MAITSRRNPLVARYRAAARGDGDLVLLHGSHLVGDAIAADVRVVQAAISAEATERHELRELVAALARARVDVVVVSARVMDAINPVRSASEIVALAERSTVPLPRIFDGNSAMVIVAVAVQDPGNIGAIARVAEAAGATGMAVTETSADPFGWKALRGSMGSALRLPIATASIEDVVAAARARRCRVIASTPRNGRSLYDVDLTGPIAILIGGEGGGLRHDLITNADERIAIPMAPPVESLNVAVTAALISYEARRQRETTSKGTKR